MTDQPQRRPTRPSDLLEPVRLAKVVRGSWTDYLVLFLRLMAGVSLIAVAASGESALAPVSI